MTTRKNSRARWSSVAGLLTVACLAGSLSAQDRPRHVGLPEDWSHRHLMFSNPGTYVQMLDTGVSQERWWNWLAVQQEPRFRMQRAKRNRARVSQGWDSTPAMVPVPDSESMPAENARFADTALARARKAGRRIPPTMERDWNIGLGAAPPVAMYPAKFTFDVDATPNCANDYVVYPVNVAGTTQANLIAFNNLYVPGLCGTAATPSFKFAYKIGTGVIQTSPVLSLDGTKVAFVESVTGASKFHVLTIGTGAGNGTSTAGVVPGVGGGNNAVDTSLTMIGAASVTRSSPFIDYGANVAYVGDDAGRIHQFTGVFTGTVTEVGGAWPVSVGASTILTGPVAFNGNIFVGGGDGRLYCVTTTGTGCAIQSIVAGTTAIFDPPIVDGSTNQVFVATQNAANSILVQVPTSLASATTVLMGNVPGNIGGVFFHIHNGAFDHNYLTGADPSAGFMYFCGVAIAQNAPTLYRVGFNASGQVNGTRDTGIGFRLSNASGDVDECPPLTEIYNASTPGGPTDLLFVTIARNQHGCGAVNANCVGSLNITSAFPTVFRSTFALPNVTGNPGTSAIVVDNVADVVPTWLASTVFAANALIVDSNGNVQQCTVAGTSGVSPPAWSTTVGVVTNDAGTLRWTMRGPYRGSWQASHAYSLNDVITDGVLTSGQLTPHLQRVTTAGTSGATQPTFSGSPTTDGGVTWTSLGAYTPFSVSSVYFSHLNAGTSLAYKLTQAGLQ